MTQNKINAWYKINANPKNKNTSDCVLRALHHATGESWEYIASELFNHMLKTGYMMNDKKCYIPFVEAYGFKACKVEIINGRKPTVKDFALTHPKGIYILRVAGHIVTVKDGLYFDSWDSGGKSIYKYWMI